MKYTNKEGCSVCVETFFVVEGVFSTVFEEVPSPVVFLTILTAEKEKLHEH